MALITISGQPGCRHDEIARLTAHLLHFDLVTESRLRTLVDQEFGGEGRVPEKAFASAITSIVARLATAHNLVLATDGAESLFKEFPGMLRVAVVAPEPRRLGSLMMEHRLERAAAKQLLRSLEAEQHASRKRRFGRATLAAHAFDIVFNTETIEPEQVAEMIVNAARLRGLEEQGTLSPQAEARIQFQARLNLSKHGIEAPGKAELRRKPFCHPSEETFANLLDFYRIAWDYEPRSFPIQWDADGRVLEAFTPDFYLPEFDLYVELTTMKQSLVTKKNRKVKLLKAIYPQVNIQVFYQKDFENLIFKYGLAERTLKA
ncbi:MAG TPA: cytidylate kinase family protein [Bryobacteraceae bacterium]|nr:cytidylate kinase family protein [Bryobacteraceae bacterium]